MEIKDMLEIEKKLNEEYKVNCEKREKLIDKINVLDRNNLETKLFITGASSVAFWAIEMLLFRPIAETNIISINLIKFLLVGVPISLGAITTKVISKVTKTKEKLGKYTNAKSNIEILEEETRTTIERDKVNSYLNVLKKCRIARKSENELIESLSAKYDIVSKEHDNRSKEEIEENIENTTKVLNEKINELNIVTTKHTLSDLYLRNNEKVWLILYICLFMPIISMVYNLPSGIMNEHLSIVAGIAPGLICAASFLGYRIFDMKIKKKIYHKINKELGENAISNDIDFVDEYNLGKSKNDVIKDIVNTKTLLEQEIRKLENLQEKDKTILEEDYQVPKLTEQPKGELRDYYLDGEFEKRSEEVLSRDLPKGKTLGKSLNDSTKR